MSSLVCRLLLLTGCLFVGPLAAVEPPIDGYGDLFAPEKTGKDVESYELKGVQPGVSSRVNLSGKYGFLKWINVEISQKRLQVRLTGEYPVLEDIDISNSKGGLKAVLTGKFPVVGDLAVSTVQGDIELDLRGKWGSDCTIDVRSSGGDVKLRLPRNKKDIGLVVTTVSSNGRVSSKGLRHASGWKRERRYLNAAHDSASVVLTIKVRTEGDIELS